jgi:hypothetical protein
MTRPPPRPATCAVCGRSGAHPSEGHTSPMCREHEQAWLRSAERARAATARDDFVRRMRAERNESTHRTASFLHKKEEVEDDPWSS